MSVIRRPVDCDCSGIDTIAESIKRDFQHPSRIFTPFVTRVLIALFLSSIIVLSVLRTLSIVAVTSIMLLFIIFYIMLDNMTGDNFPGSLPYATYPIPPHLGLDGISLANRSR